LTSPENWREVTFGRISVSAEWRWSPPARTRHSRADPRSSFAANTSELVDADVSESADHVREVIDRCPRGERRKADHGMPNCAGVTAGGGAEVVETAAAIGGNSVKVGFGI
jgi:hypothetical protein